MKQGQEQTKYGHMRREHMTHTTEPWHNSPLPEGSSRALTVPSGRGGGRSGGPSGQTRTGTQDGDLQSGTDRQGPWRSWELWKPWRCRELRRPWQSWELWRPWQMVFGGLGLGPLGPARPLQPEPLLPPQKISLGKSGGIRSPPGLDTQNSTWQDKTPGPDKQDSTSHRNQKPSWAGLEAEASSGHDEESEALTGFLSNRFHFHDKGAGG